MRRNLTGRKRIFQAGSVALAPLLWCLNTGVEAQDSKSLIDFEFYADARLSVASGEPTWFNDWLGKGRYGGVRGDTKTLFRLAEVSLLARAEITWDLKSFVHLKYDPEQDGAVDIVEAYMKYQPAPTSEVSYSIKAGLFFPHISRENIGVAWTTPYTITPSAVNSWVGEEIRALGLEAKVNYRMEDSKISFTAAIFGFNDPAGTLLAYRGWGLGDVKVGAFGELPLPPLPSIGPDSEFLKQPLWVRPIREIDNRPGYYVAVDWEYGDNWQVGALYYDNRGDPTSLAGGQYAWDTRFWNFYVEGEIVGGVKLISQYMTGNTKMGSWQSNGQRPVDVDYAAGFVLATKKFDRYRATVRADWFDADDNSFVALDNNNEYGTSFTGAFSAKIAKGTSLVFEYMHISSWRPARKTIGFAADQTNDILQLSLRQRF